MPKKIFTAVLWPSIILLTSCSPRLASNFLALSPCPLPGYFLPRGLDCLQKSRCPNPPSSPTSPEKPNNIAATERVMLYQWQLLHEAELLRSCTNQLNQLIVAGRSTEQAE